MICTICSTASLARSSPSLPNSSGSRPLRIAASMLCSRIFQSRKANLPETSWHVLFDVGFLVISLRKGGSPFDQNLLMRVKQLTNLVHRGRKMGSYELVVSIDALTESSFMCRIPMTMYHGVVSISECSVISLYYWSFDASNDGHPERFESVWIS